MSSTVRLGQVVKWPLFMAWSKVFINWAKEGRVIPLGYLWLAT